MSAGSLPIANYHRAQSLGAGTYGSVMAVYNDDGEEFALKLFVDDDDEDDSDDESPRLLELGALREISILRLIRAENAHQNIVEMADVKEKGSAEGDQGAGIGGDWMGMTMPLYKHGNLADAINQKVFTSRKDKVAIAHGLLCAIAHLHDNGIIHRDIKGENVMLQNTDGVWNPVLIDFSLAKVVVGIMYNSVNIVLEEGSTTHTGDVGTVTYVAPEVAESKPYGLKSDLWSVGVCLLEIIENHTMVAEKNKEAFKIIEEAKSRLPDQPFANLVRGLLATDPEKRLSAREALAAPLFTKFGFDIPPVSIIDIDAAVPLSSSDDDDSENSHPNTTSAAPSSKWSKSKSTLMARREKLVRKLCNELDCEHVMTPIAALCYAQQLSEIDDEMDDMKQSQGLLDCVVLASRFFELEVQDLTELANFGGSFSNWSLDLYADNEATLVMLLDYCLLPRNAPSP